MNKNIVLIGMPGAGKSTVGVVLAKTMGMDFVDVDLVICRRHGGNLQDIVNRLSHEDFLRIEGEAALSLKSENSVIATGGSMVYSEDAMRYLKEIGTVVYIRAGLSDLEKRITNLETRGIAFNPGETLADLYNARIPLYEKWADITVDTSHGDRIEDMAFKIKSELEEDE
ncbi:MAG: shikimate kinase [Oscillospiraceae bacterium]|nr:shikimate kinase [Oscillospiraceae bacterium]